MVPPPPSPPPPPPSLVSGGTHILLDTGGSEDFFFQLTLRDLVKWLDRLTANAEVTTDLGSITASPDTVESQAAADEAVLKKST
jgi:hypothetical protein